MPKRKQSKPKYATREAWLIDACDIILDKIVMPACPDHERPNYRVSVGWPVRTPKAIGQCFVKEASEGSFNEIFVTPKIDDTKKVLWVLAHELIHAVDNCASGHRGFFFAIAIAIGIEKPVATGDPGPELIKRLNAIQKKLGDIPHCKINMANAPKKQTTRMIKIECQACGFIFRTSRKFASMIKKDAPCALCRKPKLRIAT